MDPGYILIVAILILGGVLSTVGDRIGTKVGKARLSLFKLRPKNTAVLVTVVTGTLISATTLAILFAIDDGLRKGVFELDDIQKELKRKREDVQRTAQELDTTRKEKTSVQNQLDQARVEQTEANKRLQTTNESLRKAVETQRKTQAQLNRTITQQAKTQNSLIKTQRELGLVASQYRQARSQLGSVNEERKQLQAEILVRKVERQRLFSEAKRAISEREKAISERDQELAKRQEAIDQRDSKISQLDGLIQKRNLEITSREKVIAQRESRLKELESQQGILEQEVARLEKYSQLYRDLRLGKLALVRGQVIAAAIIQVAAPSAARQAVIELLQEANSNVTSGLAEPGADNRNTQILQVPTQEVEKLSKQISDGREYVVRIFSAGNYVRGEKRIEFFADAARNQLVFSGGEVLATTTADPRIMTSYQLRQRLELLISASQFRARNAGILEQIEIDGTFLRFINQLRQYDQAVDIKAIAAQDTYTAGPLRVKLVVIQNGQVMFGT
jgi:uncharacterized protein (DUF3084 family)